MFLIKCLRLLEIHHFVGVSNNVYFCNLDRKKTPVACLKNQGSWGENQHVPSNKKVVFDQEMPASACSDVQVSIVQLFIHDACSYLVYFSLLSYLCYSFYVYAYAYR